MVLNQYRGSGYAGRLCGGRISPGASAAGHAPLRCALALAVCASAASAAVLQVSPEGSAEGSYGSIREAFDAAGSDDTISLLPGRYAAEGNCDISISQAAPFRLHGRDGPHMTVIDCNGTARAFSFEAKEGHGTQSVRYSLSGVTVLHGAAGQGGCLKVDGIDVDVSNVVLDRCEAVGEQFGVDGMGGAMYTANSNSTFTDMLVRDSIAHFAGALFADGDDRSVLTNVTFLRPVGVSFGGGYIPEAQTRQRLVDCVFDSASAPFGGAMDTGGTSTAVLRRVLFVNNTARRGAGVFHFGDSSLLFDECRFINNAASNSGGAFESGTNTRPMYRNCLFQGNSAVGQGGVARSTGNSQPSIIGGRIANNTSPRGGGISVSGGTTIVIKGVEFVGNIASDLGGALECQTPTPVDIVDCVFLENAGANGGAVYLEGSTQWKFDNCSFAGNLALDGGAFYGDHTSYSLQGCELTGNHAQRDGGTFYLKSTHLALSGSEVYGSTAGRSGGGVYGFGTSHLEATDSRFVGSRAAQQGGAIWSQGELDLQDSQFWDNSVSSFGGFGGAVYLAQSPSACDSSVLRNLEFEGNKAELGGGGALFLTWTNQFMVPSFLTGAVGVNTVGASDVDEICFPGCEECTFTSNIAPYGADRASPTYRLEFVSQLPLDGLPNVPMNCTVEAVDWFENRVVNSLGMRVVASLSEATFCSLPAPPVVALSAGLAPFDSVQVLGEPGVTCSLRFEAQPEESGLPVPLSANVTMRECPAGYARALSGSNFYCRRCPEGTYSLLGQSETCRECPNEAVCPGANEVLIGRGFWPSSKSLQLGIVNTLPCPPLYCCDEDTCPLDAPCAAHRHGILCGSCDSGFADLGGECVPCNETNVGFVVLLALAGIGFTIFNVRFERVVSPQGGSADLSQVTFFGQLGLVVVPFSRLRLVASGVGSLLNLNLIGLFHTYATAVGLNSQDSSCLTPWSALGKNLAQGLVPFLLVVCLLLVLACDILLKKLARWYVTHRRRDDILNIAKGRAQRGADYMPSAPPTAPGIAGVELATLSDSRPEPQYVGRSVSHRRHRTSSVTAVQESLGALLSAQARSEIRWHRYLNAGFRLALLSYSVIGELTLRLILCEDVDGELVMVTEPSIVCFEGSHLFWGVLALLSILVWVFGFPARMYRFLTFQKRYGVDLEEAGPRRQYGILYDAFKPEYYWIGAVMLSRRSLAIAVSTLLFTRPPLRVFVLALLFLCYLLFQIHTAPYRRRFANMSENGMLVLMVLLCILQIWIELVPSDELVGETAQYPYVLILQAALIVVGGLWVIGIGLARAYKTFARIKRLWKRRQARRVGNRSGRRSRGQSICASVLMVLAACGCSCCGGEVVASPEIEGGGGGGETTGPPADDGRTSTTAVGTGALHRPGNGPRGVTNPLVSQDLRSSMQSSRK